MAKRAAADEDLGNALKYSDEIMGINSKSKIAKQIIEYVSFRRVALSTYDIETLEAFEDTCIKYPFLIDNKRYNISLVHLCGNISFKSFKNKEIKKGTEYLNKLESVFG